MYGLRPLPAAPGAVAAGALPASLRWSLPRLTLTLLFLAALAWALAHLGDVSRPLETLTVLWASPVLLAVFLGTYTAAFLCRAVAWRLLLPPQSRRTVGRLFGILQVSLGANHLFPAKVGELVRVGLLARTGVPVPVAAGSTVVARLLDVASLCLIALVLGPLAGGAAGERAPFEALTTPLILVGLAGGAGLLGARRLGRASGPGLGPGRLVALGKRLPAPAVRLVGVARDAVAGPAATPPWQLTAAAASPSPAGCSKPAPCGASPAPPASPWPPPPPRPPRPSPSPSRASSSPPAASASTRPA